MSARKQGAAKEIFTIGHSTRPIGEFIALLEARGIREVADVRTIPRSRFNPQFNQEALEKALRENGIRYEHFKDLGGLRKPRKDSPNTGWRNASFRGYADYLGTPAFAEALRGLEEAARRRRTAVMCAEAVPFRCHRSLIADALTVRGWRVYHITSRTQARLHRVTPFLELRDGTTVYPGQGKEQRS